MKEIIDKLYFMKIKKLGFVKQSYKENQKKKPIDWEKHLQKTQFLTKDYYLRYTKNFEN